MKKYFKNKNFVLGFSLLMIVVLIMLFGMIKLPYDPNEIDITHKLQGFSRAHLLGTDHLGRDILSRIMVGSRISLSIGLNVVIFGLVLGVPIGAFAGYYGGKGDEIIMKIIDTLMAFPGVLIALMFIAVFDVSLKIIVVALGIMSLPRFARIARGGFYSLREAPFIKATKARGASNFRIMFLHIIPHLIPDLLVTCSISFATAVLSEAGLSYLGLGIQPPNPSFGKMVSEAQPYILQSPSYVFIPAVAITILVLGFDLIGDGIGEESFEGKNGK